MTGYTQSADFPTTVGAHDATFNGGFDAFVAKVAVVANPANLTLAPVVDTNPVDTDHTVTATVTDASGNAVAGVTVRFSVTGSVSTSGSCVTDAGGQCSFTYNGPTFPGTDTISAYADSNGDSVQDPSEPTGAATKTWVLPASSVCGSVEGEGKLSTNKKASFELAVSLPLGGDDDDEGEIFFSDKSVSPKLTFGSTSIDAVVISGYQASIYGQGKANGVTVSFRVDVTDGPDTFSIILSNGYTASGSVTGGGIEIDDECDDDDDDDGSLLAE